MLINIANHQWKGIHMWHWYHRLFLGWEKNCSTNSYFSKDRLTHEWSLHLKNIETKAQVTLSLLHEVTRIGNSVESIAIVNSFYMWKLLGSKDVGNQLNLFMIYFPRPHQDYVSKTGGDFIFCCFIKQDNLKDIVLEWHLRDMKS